MSERDRLDERARVEDRVRSYIEVASLRCPQCGELHQGGEQEGLTLSERGISNSVEWDRWMDQEQRWMRENRLAVLEVIEEIDRDWPAAAGALRLNLTLWYNEPPAPDDPVARYLYTEEVNTFVPEIRCNMEPGQRWFAIREYHVSHVRAPTAEERAQDRTLLYHFGLSEEPQLCLGETDRDMGERLFQSVLQGHWLTWELEKVTRQELEEIVVELVEEDEEISPELAFLQRRE